jgi:phosphatidylglycerol:prolipoprotein diacylglycerol transferase
VALAIIISYRLTRRNIRAYGMNPDQTDGLFVKLIIVIFVGARLAYVISNWRFFQANPGEILRLDHGGLGSHGTIIAAMGIGYYLTRKAGLAYWALADAAAPALPIGHIFVRLGNFLNGELYGIITKSKHYAKQFGSWNVNSVCSMNSRPPAAV